MIEEMPSGQEKFIFSPGFVLSFLNVFVKVVVVVAVVVVGVVLVGVVLVGVVELGVEVLIDAKSNDNNYTYYYQLQKKVFARLPSSSFSGLFPPHKSLVHTTSPKSQ